jgi:hypothetical protein
MRFVHKSRFLLLAAAMLMVLAGCDQSEQNFGFQPGDDLIIQGPSTTSSIPSTLRYNVRAPTVNKDYTWTVEPNSSAETAPVDRNDDGTPDAGFIDVTVTDAPEDSVITISVDDGQEYTGETTLTIE